MFHILERDVIKFEFQFCSNNCPVKTNVTRNQLKPYPTRPFLIDTRIWKSHVTEGIKKKISVRDEQLKILVGETWNAANSKNATRKIVTYSFHLIFIVILTRSPARSRSSTSPNFFFSNNFYTRFFFSHSSLSHRDEVFSKLKHQTGSHFVVELEVFKSYTLSKSLFLTHTFQLYTVSFFLFAQTFPLRRSHKTCKLFRNKLVRRLSSSRESHYFLRRQVLSSAPLKTAKYVRGQILWNNCRILSVSTEKKKNLSISYQSLDLLLAVNELVRVW